MGNFVGQIQGNGEFKIPYELRNHIQVRTTIPFDDHDGFLLTTALFGINNEIQVLDRDYSLVPHGIILINQNENFSYTDTEALGYVLPLIIISLGEAKERNLSDLIMLTMYLEEFIHHFLMIHDEEIAKNKVVEILKNILNFPVEFNHIYNQEWKEYYPDIRGEDIDD